MNQVFIPRPVGSNDRSIGIDVQQVRDIGIHVLAAAIGGGILSAAISEIGLGFRQLDPTSRDIFVLAAILVVSGVLIALQVANRMGPLPERKEQVPRRWVGWKRRWLTAAAYGGVLGGGAFTPLRHPAMYTLGLLVFIAPSVWAASAVGAMYGGNRGATVLYAWLLERRGYRTVPGLGRGARLLLAVAATSLPIWIAFQLS